MKNGVYRLDMIFVNSVRGVVITYDWWNTSELYGR